MHFQMHLSMGLDTHDKHQQMPVFTSINLAWMRPNSVAIIFHFLNHTHTHKLWYPQTPSRFPLYTVCRWMRMVEHTYISYRGVQYPIRKFERTSESELFVFVYLLWIIVRRTALSLLLLLLSPSFIECVIVIGTFWCTMMQCDCVHLMEVIIHMHCCHHCVVAIHIYS